MQKFQEHRFYRTYPEAPSGPMREPIFTPSADSIAEPIFTPSADSIADKQPRFYSHFLKKIDSSSLPSSYNEMMG